MKKRNLLCLLTLIPQIFPTGLYMAGDNEILGIKSSGQEMTEYRISKNNIGSKIILNENTQNPFFIFVSKNKDDFEKVLNPPAQEDLAMKNNLISLSDKKLLGIVHYLFTLNMPARRLQIHHTASILSMINDAVDIRIGKQSKNELNPTKWQQIKDSIEDAIVTKKLTIKQSKISIAPIQVNDGERTSDSE